jgi:hypothetical protein
MRHHLARPRIASLALSIMAIFIAHDVCRAVDPAPIPIGYDAYLQWDRWPYQRIGQRAYMRSTYDRRGGNEAADASHFLYQLADDNNIVLDVAQSGMLYFARQNHWHGSPWRYVVDGTEHVVQETSSATRDESLKESFFIPREQFPAPLALTWTTTKGAALNWVPIGFNDSLRLGYTWTCYGTGYFIYHQWVPGTQLTQPLQAFDGKATPPQQVIDLFEDAGNDPLPVADSSQATQMGLKEQRGHIRVPTEGAVEVCTLTGEPGMIRGINFTVARNQAIDFGKTRLRITWDDRPHASIDAPLALFFGAGTLYNRDDREYLVKAFPVNIRFDADKVYLGCYLPMPYFQSARIELVGNDQSNPVDAQWQIRHTPLNESPQRLGYLHATYRDFPIGELGHDLVLLDTHDIEGSSDWSGSFIGTSFTFSDRSVLTTLEGDPRFFFDGSRTPQGQGTGTEEWGGGGDYWGGLNMTLPFAGHPCGARSAREAKNAEDNIQSAYRFLLADQMPFNKHARICLEHGGENLSTEHYRTLTYWYGRPGATIVKSDSLQIGDSASEDAHQYHSPQASQPYSITSRYELGVDTIAGIAEPAAAPQDYVEFEFDADANKPYYVWLHGKRVTAGPRISELWLQFDDEIGTNGTSDPSYSPRGWGLWRNDTKPASDQPYQWRSKFDPRRAEYVIFNSAGKHRLRVQARQPGLRLDRILLSTSPSTPPTDNDSGAQAIVLTTANATDHKGAVSVQDDAAAMGGKALEFAGQGTPDRQPIEIYPAHTDMARKTTGTSEFNLQIDINNVGVMLRRKLDYSFPNQRAAVFVQNSDGQTWSPAGTWYLAGSNTCVYSRPNEELGATQHNVQTSNRQFRDDEFLLPKSLTAGRSSIRIRVQFEPTNIPLFPGHPLAEQAWSEIRYDAWCFIAP